MANPHHRLTAMLGPTNTGKTHYAIERMLAYPTGMFGLPLRLLAREVYDRLVKARGPEAIALITGEERIIPPKARYWICTVEAMPIHKIVDFVAVDEIQLAADPERGHVFTDRLLNLRGTQETLFLGAHTMRKLIAHLLPDITFKSRPRLSSLEYTGSKKISRMPGRTAIVSFSVDSVYAIAELVRRQKGGAAVVMGALSPRTRNAQVELYQSGEVDYIIATDAIGMGLNLDIDHVAFSAVSKFDGRKMRNLHANELGQIAGRAGRYKASGSFGVTGDVAPFSAELVDALENHRFAPIQKLQWRSSNLNFHSVDGLVNSLEQTSPDPHLLKARPAEDQRSLIALADQPMIAARVTSRAGVERLWDVCGIPDFPQLSFAAHIDLLEHVFVSLFDQNYIDEDWFATKVKRLDNTAGDIDALSKRLSYIRSFTYLSQRAGWLEQENYWREETRRVEDGLSDALHSALTQRFVDRRSSFLMRRLKQRERLVAQIDNDGTVTIDEQFIGKLKGFRFQVDSDANEQEIKPLRQAAYQALQPEFNLRAERMYNAPDTEFDITEQGGLMWGEYAVGKLVKGDDILAPKIEVFVDDEAGVENAQRVQKRLSHYVSRKIDAAFEPLIAMRDSEEITGSAKGLGYRIYESLGVIPRSAISRDVKALDQDARGQLRKHGIRFGQYTVFQHAMLKPAPTRLRLLLWGLAEDLAELPDAPPPGLVTIPASASAPKGYYTRAGYRLAGERAIRIDMLERLADLTRSENVKEGFESTPDMLSITGMTLEQFADLMVGLGFEASKGEREKPAKEGETAEVENEVFYVFKWVPKRRDAGDTRPDKQPRRKPNKGKAPHKPRNASAGPKPSKGPDPDNPFAALAALKGS